MKNSNNHKTTKSPVRKITTFAVLSVIVFLAISCNLNAGGTGNTEEAVKILTGPCGETKENSNDVVEINGQKYYTTKSNYEKDYYSENLTTIFPVEVKTPYTEETKDLFHKIRVKYWREWMEDGVWQEIDISMYTVYIKDDIVEYRQRDSDARIISILELLEDKMSSFVGDEQGMKIYNGLLTVSPKQIYTTLNHTYKNINLVD